MRLTPRGLYHWQLLSVHFCVAVWKSLFWLAAGMARDNGADERHRGRGREEKAYRDRGWPQFNQVEQTKGGSRALGLPATQTKLIIRGSDDATVEGSPTTSDQRVSLSARNYATIRASRPTQPSAFAQPGE